MKYLVDTNGWINFLKNPDSVVAQRISATPPDEFSVCSVVWAELLHGARKYQKRADREDRIRRTLMPYHSFPFDNAAAERYATIRDRLEARGETIGGNDYLIAAIALVHNLTVVTNNGEFRRVDGLKVEDWSVV